MTNGKGSFKCTVCNKSFANGNSLSNHNNSKHAARISKALVPRNGVYYGGFGNDGGRTNYDGSAVSPLSAKGGSKLTRQMTTNGIREAVAGIMGSTNDGRAWAMAALHPCGAGEIVARNIGTFSGMCDTMTSSVATPVYRGETFVSYSQQLFETAPSTATTYGVDIVIPPIPEIDFIYRLIDDSTMQKTGWIVVRQPDFNLPQPVAYPKPEGGNQAYGYDVNARFTTFANTGYGKVRTVACGHTIELDAAGLNNQGRIVVGQMEGQWRQVPLTVPRIDYETKAFVTDVDTKATEAAVTQVEVLGTGSSSNTWLLEVPTDPSTIVSTCPNAYHGEAKHGAYIVSKFTSPLLGYSFKRTGSEEVFQTASQSFALPNDSGYHYPYMPSSSFAISTSKNNTGDLASADSFYVKDANIPNALFSGFGTGVLPLSSGDGPTQSGVLQSTLHPGISEPSDMMTAVVMVRNIPAGQNNGVTASLRIKSRNYFECISNGTNPAVSPYVHPPAQFDFQALNSVIIAGKQLSDAYPASANSLSTILNSVWNALKTYGQPIASTVGDLAIPFASTAARLLDKGITHGINLESQLARGGYGTSFF